MSSLPVFVGLDYHQDAVQVCVLDSAGRQLANRSVANDAAAVAAVARRHGRPQRIAVEACCGAAAMADELSAREGLSVELAHPGYVARLKRSPDKSDFSDGRLLADLARVDYLPKVWLAPESTRQLRRLVRHRARPYYLLQADPVQGTGHLRTPLAVGIEIMRRLQGRLSGIALPKFIVDTPGGLGKVPVGPDYVIGRAAGVTRFCTHRGVEVDYVDPPAGDGDA